MSPSSALDDTIVANDAYKFYETRGPLEDAIAEAVADAALQLRRAQLGRKAFLKLVGELERDGCLDDQPSRAALVRRYREAMQRRQRLADRGAVNDEALEAGQADEGTDDGQLVMLATLLYPDVMKAADELIARANQELQRVTATAREMVTDRAHVTDEYIEVMRKWGFAMDVGEQFSRRQVLETIEVPADESPSIADPLDARCDGKVDRGEGIPI